MFLPQTLLMSASPVPWSWVQVNTLLISELRLRPREQLYHVKGHLEPISWKIRQHVWTIHRLIQEHLEPSTLLYFYKTTFLKKDVIKVCFHSLNAKKNIEGGLYSKFRRFVKNTQTSNLTDLCSYGRHLFIPTHLCMSASEYRIHLWL